MKKKILWIVPILLMVGVLKAGISYTNLVINKTGQGVNFTENIDLKEWSRFSLQAVYSAADSLSTDTVIDGEFATAQITVDEYQRITAAKASVTVEIATTTGLSGESVVLNGRKFIAGTHFAVGASSTAAALNLSVAVNATDGLLATASGSTVTVTANDFGTAANSWSATTSDASIIVVGAATFANGVTEHTIIINGVTLTESTDFTAETSTEVTAKSISDAIVGNATLAATIISTWTSGVVFATSTVPISLNWNIIVSTTAFSVSAENRFTGGIDSEIVASTITAVAHGLTTGIGVLFGVTAGTAPQGLLDQTTYYIIKVNDNEYAVAASTTDAVAGTEITISTFTGSGTFTFNPLAMTGSPSFKWQQSNDNSNWTDLALSSVTFSAAGNTMWDVGEVDYRYIRINFLAPTTGGLALQVYQSGKRD